MENIKNKAKIFKLTEHPIAVMALACFWSAFIFGTEAFSRTGLIFLICISFFIVIITFWQSDTKEEFSTLLIKSIGYVMIMIIGYCIFAIQQKSGAFLFLFAVFLAMIYGLYCFLNKSLNISKIIVILFVLGFVLRLAYVLYTTVHQRQHDVEDFDLNANGHAAYILYIFNNGSIPILDIREHWQFYHPPLHHIISAIWLWIETAFGITDEASYEGLQYLTLFYSALSMYLSYRIMRELKLRKIGLVIAFAIVAFHPTFIIFAGSVNNDILSVTFLLGAVLNTIVWYKKRTAWNILKIALCIGLGMFTKLSVWMVAPAVAIVFLSALINNKGKLKKLIGQMAAFITVCAPLGLYWSIRNYLLYKVPFTYVPKLAETNRLYVGKHSVMERLFDFNFNQFESVYNQLVFYAGKYYEYNPTIGLFKTAMFDEVINDTYYPEIKLFGIILFWSSVVLGLLGFIGMIYIFCKKKSMDVTFKWFFAALFAVILGSYYIFCFEFSFSCTQNIRYASPLIVLGALFIGMWITKTLNKRKKSAKLFRIAVITVTICFCVSSAITYTLIGI